MNIPSATLRLILVTGLTISVIGSALHAQEDNVVELTLHARPVPSNPDSVRLLPREHELRDGNAAIELLRMPWEQHNFMVLERELMSDWLKMKGDDPELQKYENAFLTFKQKMRRAAYKRTADWDYPLGEQPYVTILLPDAQGMRRFAGRVMSLWIKIQIAKGNVEEAEEGVLIQFACARHVSRTPFVVCHLIGNAIAQIGLEQMESLIQHPDSRNYHFALSSLPDSMGDFNAAMDIEMLACRYSMNSLTGPELPPVGDPRWESAFNEFFAPAAFSANPETDRRNMLKQAEVFAKELPGLTDLDVKAVNRMAREEVVVRWLIANTDELGAKYLAAIQMPRHEAIQALIALGDEARQIKAKTVPSDNRGTAEAPSGAVATSIFDLYSERAMIGCHQFNRQAKLLQIVEAIRHFASLNENQLPKSLSEIDMDLPTDPFTNRPAEYELNGKVATLRWPRVENLKKPRNGERSYRIKMADSN